MSIQLDWLSIFLRTFSLGSVHTRTEVGLQEGPPWEEKAQQTDDDGSSWKFNQEYDHYS